jgi:hypothetical protein
MWLSNDQIYFHASAILDTSWTPEYVSLRAVSGICESSPDNLRINVQSVSNVPELRRTFRNFLAFTGNILGL